MHAQGNVHRATHHREAADACSDARRRRRCEGAVGEPPRAAIRRGAGGELAPLRRRVPRMEHPPHLSQNFEGGLGPRRHRTGSERMGSPTHHTLQDLAAVLGVLSKLGFQSVRPFSSLLDTVVQREGWSCSTLVLQLGLHG
jgi:hypothetical protein